MHLTLVLPRLAQAVAASAPRSSKAAAPALARLIGHATLRFEPEGWSALLASLYGIARQNDRPVAALRARHAGIDPGAAYWLRATPVTLIPGRDDVRVSGVAADLDESAARALLAALGAHFAGDGLTFHLLGPCEWLARMERRPMLVTHALDTVIGEPLRPRLPSGDDADEWRRWEQEIQMLLHAHAVNEAREAADLPPVNGVWFDEGGTMPECGDADVATFGDEPTLAVLAHCASQTPALPFASMTGALARRNTRVIIASHAAELAQVEASLAQPAEAALRSGRVETISIAAAGAHGRVALWTTRPPSLLKRWLAGTPDVLAIVRDTLQPASS